MTLFGRKGAAPESVRPPLDVDANAAPHPAATHHLTVDLSRAMDLAAMLASSRASQFIEIVDLLAGLYIYEWDRMSAYWPEENREHVEEMLQEMCQISPQRWNYWIQAYDARRKEDEPQPRWKQFRKPKQGSAKSALAVPSAGLRAVFDAAEVVSPFRDPRGKPGRDLEEGGAVPVLTSECLLLCMVKFVASDTGRKLGQSGLNVLQLERAVIDPKRSPLR
jgi:hypothetical protein